MIFIHLFTFPLFSNNLLTGDKINFLFSRDNNNNNDRNIILFQLVMTAIFLIMFACLLPAVFFSFLVSLHPEFT